MLHFRKRIVSLFRPPCPPPASALSSHYTLHRLLFSTTITSSSAFPNPFDVEDYLVTTCHLTPAQAFKASKCLSHLKSASKPDAVLAFLSGLGLSPSDIAAVVVNDARFLCANVEKTLVPRVTELLDLGLSRPQIARLIPLARSSFRSRSLGRNVGFWLPVLGSYDKLLLTVKGNSSLLGADLERVAKPNLALLRQCGINIRGIGDGFLSRLLTRDHKHLQDAMARINEFGVQWESRMFHYALKTIGFLSREKLIEKIGLLKKLGLSQDDVCLAVGKAPDILGASEEKIRRNLQFLRGDAGLEIPYIARRPALLMYSLERRLFPRHCLLKVLKAKGLLDGEVNFYNMASLTEEKFLDKFVDPYKDSVPGLADSYASSVLGKHQTKLLYDKTKREPEC